MLGKTYKHGEFGEAEATEVAKELAELYTSRGFEPCLHGWTWTEQDSSFKTTCDIYDMRPQNIDNDGHFVLVVLVEYNRKPLTDFGLIAKFTVELPVEQIEQWLDNNDIDEYEYSDEHFLAREAMCDLTGYCRGTSCKYWSKCKD